jgi:hypothetical protein
VAQVASGRCAGCHVCALVTEDSWSYIDQRSYESRRDGEIHTRYLTTVIRIRDGRKCASVKVEQYFPRFWALSHFFCVTEVTGPHHS